MTADSAVTPWTLTMPAGTLLERTFTLTILGSGAPYNISGFQWEYVIRPTATDLTVPPLVSITTVASAAGQITVTATSTLSQVLVTILPAATASLAPQQYAHTLWSQPGSSSQFTWATGSLVIMGNPQP